MAYSDSDWQRVREYEEFFLACVLQDPTIIYNCKVREEHFYCTESRQLFRAMNTCADRKLKIDYISVSSVDSELDKRYAPRIADIVPSAANWRFYETKIIEQYQRSKLISLGKRLTAIAHVDSPVEFIETAEKELLEMATGNEGMIKRLGELIPDTIKRIEERYNLKGRIPGLGTGLPALDNMIGGFQNDRYVVIGARPSEGKSALMLNMACHIGLREEMPVGIISAESSNEEIMMRVFSSEGRINGTSISMGMLARTHFASLMGVAQSVDKAPIYVYDAPNVSFNELKSVARQMRAVRDIKALFVDYAQLIQWHDKKLPRHEQVAEISKGLKQLARELKIPVITLAQLRRDAEGREPDMADLGESSQLEKDADTLIFIHHPKADKKEEEPGTSRLLVKKNRDGARGAIPVVFMREYVRFFPAAKEHE